MSPTAVQDVAAIRSNAKHTHLSFNMLRVSSTSIVNSDGNEVVLKGAGLGGMLNMENFITGYSGHEHEHRAALTEVLGKENAEFFSLVLSTISSPKQTQNSSLLLDLTVSVCRSIIDTLWTMTIRTPLNLRD
jgi:hypothetical protein